MLRKSFFIFKDQSHQEAAEALKTSMLPKQEPELPKPKLTFENSEPCDFSLPKNNTDILHEDIDQWKKLWNKMAAIEGYLPWRNLYNERSCDGNPELMKLAGIKSDYKTATYDDKKAEKLANVMSKYLQKKFSRLTVSWQTTEQSQYEKRLLIKQSGNCIEIPINSLMSAYDGLCLITKKNKAFKIIKKIISKKIEVLFL